MPIFLEAPALSEQSLLEFIKKADEGRDFVAVQRYFLDYGTYSLKHVDRMHVLWQGMSLELCEAITALAMGRHIDYITCDPAVYWIQSCGVPLPVAKQTGRTYTKPHWVPIKLIAVKGADSGEDSGKEHPGESTEE